ncbi:PilZ-like domain-containing protein [Geotalea sp. SG265]|uniref:PilZ-like domain-containing protein n=1 Tax=Geotalea sp. SG265 TaxID=2922867 RepID=UPI001FAE9995|nr:PilZ-like domain-containing protein [Geotalea sp. SG265]
MIEQKVSYRDYFYVNQRARVDLPLSNSRFFHEWAVIDTALENLITLRLSRDVLPHNLLLEKGEPVSIRAGSGGQGYRCHGIIEAIEREDLALRLSGAIIPDELRSYFRLDMSPLAFDYAAAGREETWEFTGNRGIVGTGIGGNSSSVQGAPQELPKMEFNGVQPVIVNISGGGLRAQTPEEIPAGSILSLAFNLPHPLPQPVQLLAEVVYSQPLPSIWRTGTCFTTGMKYLKINERSRDSIIQFVCSEEIKKIRSCNKRFHSLTSG